MKGSNRVGLLRGFRETGPTERGQDPRAPFGIQEWKPARQKATRSPIREWSGGQLEIGSG